MTAGAVAASVLPAVGAAFAVPGSELDEEPILYSQSKPTDPVAKLQERVARGDVKLPRDSRGYLAAVLKELKIPASSQVLVYSKTSFQRDLISPNSPRALYFNDDVYIGWVQGGGVLEISAADPKLGGTFYTIDQYAEAPTIKRQTYECLACHEGSLTSGVPGHTLRSVYTGKDGLPLLAAGTFITTDRSPMEERWGGFYVTGKHGSQLHMGNLFVRNIAEAEDLDRSAGANVTNLKKYFNPAPYLTPHSDMVALMVLQHQTHVHNLIAKASYDTRRALHFEQLLNRELKRAPNYRSDSTTSRIKAGCEPLVRGLLFSGAAALDEPVTGTSTFTADFPNAGPRDSKGRSLRDLDLKSRLLRYPCSYLIHSEAFEALPAEAKNYVYGRLREILDGKDTSKEFEHLTPADRTAIREILLETKPDFRAAAAPQQGAGG